ncbi:MAG TPA: ATP-grasp domain-containing protein, partial [Mycobacteriales bacterium]|nr:ATP-grasp domain-containing protein [Mycobacteriales bacterium]
MLGDVDLIAALGAAGVPCTAVVGRGDPARYSRFTSEVLDLPEPVRPEQLLDLLVAWAENQSTMQAAQGQPEPSKPVLYYNTDRDLLFVSRHRTRLEQHFRFVIAEAELIEVLADKALFQQRAVALGLPVPPAKLISWSESRALQPDLRLPVILKPVTRQRLQQLGTNAKAFRVEDADQLSGLLARWSALDVDAIAQEVIPGPESAVESYHAYIDLSGAVVAEFTGAKIRTFPREYGHSTALRISDAGDVAELGRHCVEQLRLTGIAKVDFKRDPEGRLHLLEVNPRFSLWHHLGAVAGANLPALVHADLTGQPRPAAVARTGTRWCHLDDRWPAVEDGMSWAAWSAWAVGCEARSGADWNDPWPFV